MEVQQILDALTEYARNHPHIDPDFQAIDRIERDPEIWELLRKLPEEVFVNITMLLLLTPEEAAHSLASQEFDHPIPARV